jgi:hypothetical protein
VKHAVVSIVMLFLLLAAEPAAAQTLQGTAFSYQGELRQNNAPVTANVDMVFALFDAASDGNQWGPPLQFTAATANAVAVANGIFTVTLDFGPAFNTLVSDQRWLQVSINGNVLSPRTQIQNAPYALQSRTAEFAYAIQNASVGAAQIVPTQVQARVTGSCAAGSSIRVVAQDGSVTCQAAGGSGTVTSVATDATLTGGPITTSGTLGIAAGAIGTAQINNTQVQARVTGSCDSGQKLLSVNADGSVNCATDVAGGSGTVTSVGTGPSLSGGPITTSGTIDIAAGGVGLAQIDTSQVQARAAGTCALGSYLRGINANGSLVCTPLVASPRLVAIAAGGQPSIAIGSDGYPVVSYFDDIGTTDLKVAKCADATCNTTQITTVDATANVGYYTSIAIGSDTFPVISYYDFGNGHLKVAKCRDVACTTTPYVLTLDMATGVGLYTSIAIGADTFPVISYYSGSGATGLKVCKCKNASCTTAPQLTTLDTGGGEYTSIAIGADNNPVVSYFDVTNGHLKVAKCTSPSCGTSTLHTVDTSASVGEYTSVAIGSDTFPVISYADFGTGHLKVAKCTDASCSAAASIHVVDAVGGAQDTSIRIGSNGFPLIAYFDSQIGNLKVASCANAACTGEVTSTIDSAATSYASLAIGGDTLPVLAYNGGYQLRVARCNNDSCQ